MMDCRAKCAVMTLVLRTSCTVDLKLSLAADANLVDISSFEVSSIYNFEIDVSEIIWECCVSRNLQFNKSTQKQQVN